MKVYLVEVDDYDSSELLGIFTDRAQAEKLAEEYNAIPESIGWSKEEKEQFEKWDFKSGNANVSEVELDVPESLWMRMRVRIDQAGKVRSIEKDIEPFSEENLKQMMEYRDTNRTFDTDNYLVVQTNTRSIDEAIAYAQKKHKELVENPNVKWGYRS